MADNFGDQQNRVLSVTQRSLDNVVFQYRKPPLTSEWNLINQISNEKIQEITKASYPSGWMTVGEILQDWSESDVQTGQVNCSATYTANSFKLFSKKDNVAVVNGWPLLIEGTNSPDSNNIITLGAPAGQLYDFVFLEVWRKLVGKDDPIYPCGNVLSNPYSDNEIEWPAIGTETTKRVQFQYRIRVTGINSPVNPTHDGFDIENIHPIGGRTDGEYTSYKFEKYGASDIGLYVSGDGSSTSQTVLNTVDGYVYAIPMFMVCRRQKWDDIFTASTMRRTFVDKAELADGYVPDRPDGALSDVIYKDDIVDFRHKILSSGKDVEMLLDQTVSKLVAGELTTAVKRGFGTDGDTNITASIGGGTLTKVECLNTSGSIPSIGTGSDTTDYDFKRRAFSNAEYTHDHNVIRVPVNGSGAWIAGTISVASVLSTAPDGSVESVDGFYMPDESSPIPTGVTATATTITIADTGGNSIVETSKRLLMEFTFKYDSSSVGFKDVPREFLEAGKGTYLPIATRDNDVTLRFNNDEYLLNYGLNPGPHLPGETDPRDFLRYKGGNYTENSAFGHEMVIHRTTNGSGVVTINLSDSKYNGYHILGVKSVEPATAPDVYGDPVDFTAQRSVTTGPYVITSYSITSASYPNTDVRIVLYIGSKAPATLGDYSVADSLKFFEFSKQGRGVIDTYEIIEIVGVEDGATGTFWLDAGDKPIIALLTKAKTVSGYVEGQAFAWKYDSSNISVDITVLNNSNLPVLVSSEYTSTLLPTKIKVTAAIAAGWGNIRVPVLVHSYVTQTETPYNFFYKTNAYQGLLDSSTAYYGKIMEEGPAVITTLGSGAVSNYSYANDFQISIGKAIFQSSSRIVTGVIYGGNLPKWTAYVKTGDYIRQTASSQYYRILSVDSDTQLTLAEAFVGSGGTPVNYETIRTDVPHDNISNVVDRLPALKITALTTDDLVDYRCYSDNFFTSPFFFHGIYLTQPKQKMQDPLNTLTNDFVLGASSTSKRGRNNFILTNGQNSIFKLSDTPRPQMLYEYAINLTVSGHNRKIYQIYLFNQSAKGMISGESDLTGRLYLMVISGETKPVDPTETSLNGFFNRDTVDIYELVGRPIIKMG